MGKLKLRSAKKQRLRIAKVKLADGTWVEDPAEVRRLLRADGFTVDELTGDVGLGPALRNKKPQ